MLFIYMSLYINSMEGDWLGCYLERKKSLLEALVLDVCKGGAESKSAVLLGVLRYLFLGLLRHMIRAEGGLVGGSVAEAIGTPADGPLASAYEDFLPQGHVGGRCVAFLDWLRADGSGLGRGRLLGLLLPLVLGEGLGQVVVEVVVDGGGHDAIGVEGDEEDGLQVHSLYGVEEVRVELVLDDPRLDLDFGVGVIGVRFRCHVVSFLICRRRSSP